MRSPRSLTKPRLEALLPEYVGGQLGSEEEDTAVFMAKIADLKIVGEAGSEQLLVRASEVKRRPGRSVPWENYPARDLHVDLIPDPLGDLYGHEIENTRWRRVFLLGASGEAFFLQHPDTPYTFNDEGRRKDDK